jgi:hypothetical protein
MQKVMYKSISMQGRKHHWGRRGSCLLWFSEEEINKGREGKENDWKPSSALLHTNSFCTPPSTKWLFYHTTFYILTLFVHYLLQTDSFCPPPSTYWFFLYTIFYILTLFVRDLRHIDVFCTLPSYKKSQYVEGDVLNESASACRRWCTKRVSM